MTALEGGCLCGGVRFRITEAPTGAGYCHCTNCQRRTGTAFNISAWVAPSGLEVLEGAELIRSFQPAGGAPKAFCSNCGAHLFSGDPAGESTLGIRFGAFDGDPGVRPTDHQYVGSAASWDPIPDDGLPRHMGPRPAPR
jgi:hypothetical protein